MATDGNGPAQFWGDTSLRADEVERVRAGICARFDGEAREELLGMLLDGVQVNDKTEETMNVKHSPSPATIVKSKKPEPQQVEWPDEAPSTPKAGVAPTQATVRAWARENGIPVNPRGSVRTDVMEAYTAAQGAAPDPRAEEPPGVGQVVLEIEVDLPKIDTETASLEVPTLSLDGATTPPAEGARVKNAGEFAARWNALTLEQREQATRSIGDRSDAAIRCFLANHDGLEHEYSIERRNAAAALSALDLTLRKWGEERARAAARKTLIIDLSAQVIAAEHERRADGELIASMDRALRDAQDVIEDLRRQLAKAGAGRSWWRAAS